MFNTHQHLEHLLGVRINLDELLVQSGNLGTTTTVSLGKAHEIQLHVQYQGPFA